MGCGTARRGRLLCKQDTGRFESDTVHQVLWSGSINGDAADCKSVAPTGTPGSIPGHSTKLWDDLHIYVAEPFQLALVASEKQYICHGHRRVLG